MTWREWVDGVAATMESKVPPPEVEAVALSAGCDGCPPESPMHVGMDLHRPVLYAMCVHCGRAFEFDLVDGGPVS